MNQKQFLALLGFAFAAAWITLGFGDAVLCLLAAGAFYATGAFLEGELNLAEVGERLQGRSTGSPYAPPPSSGRPRVR